MEYLTKNISSRFFKETAFFFCPFSINLHSFSVNSLGIPTNLATFLIFFSFQPETGLILTPLLSLLVEGAFCTTLQNFKTFQKKVSKTAVFVLIDERTFSPVGKNQKNIFVRKNTIESLHAALTRNDLS